jgi:hypothetical protein
VVWPVETWITSAPAAPKARATSTASSGVIPSSTQSVAEMRTDIGAPPARPAHGPEHLQREAEPVLQRAAVFVVRRLLSGVMKLESR